MSQRGSNITSIRHLPSRIPITVMRYDDEFSPLLRYNYTTLSPGLERRMVYSNYLRYRRYMNDIKNDITLKTMVSKTKIKINYNDFFCPICQCDDNIDSDKNSNNIIQRQLECNHIFHMECIDKWLIIKKECPLCKSNI